VVIEVATGVTDVESPALISTVPRNKSKSDSAMIKETVGTTVPTRSRVSKRTVTGDRDNAALFTLKFSAMTEAGPRVSAMVEDVQDTELGIALVASALGKKVPRVTPTSIALVTTECRVEVAIGRKKNANKTSVAPPNSIDSDDAGHGDVEIEIRLSQSDVHVEFPGEICEIAAILVAKDDIEAPSVALIAEDDDVATLANAMSSVAAHEEIDDAPTDPGEVVTPRSESATAGGEASLIPDLTRTPTTTLVVPGSEEDKIARKARFDATQERIREIAASQILQEELSKSNPNLASVSSFLNRVCGVGQSAKLLKETAETFIQRGIAERVMSDALKSKGAPLESGGVFGIAEALLIVNPTTDTLETGEIVGGDNAAVALEEPRDPTMPTALVAGHACETELSGTATVAYEPANDLHANDGTVGAGDVLTREIDESDAISHADMVMSIGESSSKESTPPFEREGSSRRDFPGRVTRSAAGCRIYVPPMVNDKSDCPGHVLNDDGTCTIRMTLGQDLGDALVGVGGVLSTTAPTEEIADSVRALETDDNPKSPVGDALLIHEPLVKPPVTFDDPRGPTPATSIDIGATPGSVVPGNAAVMSNTVTPKGGTIAVPNQVIVLVDEWVDDVTPASLTRCAL